MEYHHIRIDRSTPIPLATQISQQISWLIASQQLKEGERLPAVRDLAGHLGVNLHTIRAAYQQLEADGLISTRRGSRAIIIKYDRDFLAAKTPDLLIV